MLAIEGRMGLEPEFVHNAANQSANAANKCPLGNYLQPPVSLCLLHVPKRMKTCWMVRKYV